MSRIRMKVEIHNESNTTLRWATDKLVSGSWTPGGWLPSQGVAVGPGQSTAWQVEGDLVLYPTSGAEARVWYTVDGSDQQLYVHVNSPLIESQYANTSHVWAPTGYEADWSGGQGHEARLIIRFRNAVRRAVPGFKPSVNALHFSNHDWSSSLPAMTVGRLWNQLRARLGGGVADKLGIGGVDDNWLPFTRADQGLCGGMVFAVMDYYAARLLPPPDIQPPNQESRPLFQFIRDRLVDSFDILGSGYRWLAYSSPLYPDGDEGVLQVAGLARGRAWISYRDEWPRIREDIDAGRLSPIGLIQTDSLDIGANHQVLGYAYLQSGQVVSVWIYDPNVPNSDNLVLRFDITNTSNAISVTREGYAEPGKKIRAILHMDGYQPRPAPFGRLPEPPKGLEIVEQYPDYAVVGGSATAVETTPCGDTVKKGHWILTTSQQFPVKASGSNHPVITWSISGKTVNGTGTLPLTIGGRAYTLGYSINPATGELKLNSGAGDSYEVGIKVTVSEAGATLSKEATFTAAGVCDGYRPGDHALIVKCIAKNIPVEVDWNVYHAPAPDPHFDLEKWRAQTIEHVTSNPGLGQSARQSVEKLINLQVKEPNARIALGQVIRRRGGN